MRARSSPASSWVLVLVAATCWAAEPLPLKWGPNPVDLDGDGRPDLIVKARRENFNAHSSTHYAFYRSVPGGWEMVGIEPSPGAPLLLDLATTEGADCILKDVRLHKEKDRRVSLVIATRDLGASYGDEQPVAFSWFELDQNDEGVPGWTPLYFAKVREKRTTRAYCDVGKAFAAEANHP